MNEACVGGCTVGPTPVDIDDGPAEVVACEDGFGGCSCGIRVGYRRTTLEPAIFEVLPPIEVREMVPSKLLEE